MKKLSSGFCRKLIGAILTVCMLFGIFAPTVMAAPKPSASSEKTTSVNFVSFGDSMSNGFKLEGYDKNCGIEDYAYCAYANQFADWLKEYLGVDEVNHAQLAMSGMRAEDLHLMLEFDYNDAEKVTLAESDYYPGNEAWYNAFNEGDFYTWETITSGSRPINAVQNIIEKTGNEYQTELFNPETYDGYISVLAKYFQESVKDADIISLAMGNANFGVFMFDAINDLTTVKRFGLDLEASLNGYSPLAREYVIRFVESLDETITEAMEAVGSSLAYDSETVTVVKDAILYTLINFIIGYIGSIEAILELKDGEPVEIMQLALMDASKKIDRPENCITPSDVIGLVYDPLNAFIASYPLYMQLTGNEAYQNAKFIFVDLPEIKCFSDDFKEKLDANDPYTRNMFITDIVGYCECKTPCDDINCPTFTYRDIWKLLKKNSPYSLLRPSYATVLEYEALSEEEKLLLPEEYVYSFEMYLALERTIAECAEYQPEIDKIILSYLKDGDVTERAVKLAASNVPENLFDIQKVIPSLLMSDVAILSTFSNFAHRNTDGGVSPHTSEEGHTAICEAMKKAYVNGYSAKNLLNDRAAEIFDRLLSAVREFSEETLESVKVKYPDAFKAFEAVMKYADGEEAELLCDRINALYTLLSKVATPEIKALVCEKIYELITRIQTLAAKLTATRLEPTYYLSIGDSTLSGYGLDKYVHGEFNGEGQVLGTEAPVLLAKKLFGEDYKNHFKKLDKGGLRIDDLLVWLGLDEYRDDFYNRYTMDENAVESETAYYQKLYESEIKKADLITLAIGGGNITNFIGQQMKQLQKGEPIYEMDWTRYFPDTDRTEIDGYIKSIEKLLEGRLPTVQGISAEALAPVVAESFLFGMIGYVNDYGKVIDRIHEINPDAHIVIVGFFNPIDDMEIPVSFGDTSFSIPVGSILGMLIEGCNATNIAYALQNRDHATYVSIHETTTILDEQGIFDLESQLKGMISQTWLTHAGANGHVYIADKIYEAITVECTPEDLVTELRRSIKDLISKTEEMISDITEGALSCAEKIKAAYEEALASLELLYGKATSGFTYNVDPESSFYVALGDTTATGYSYIDLLSEYVGTDSVNLSESGILTKDVISIVNENAEMISAADLITLGYGNAAIVDYVTAGLASDTDADWSVVFGKENSELAEKLIAKAKAALAEYVISNLGASEGLDEIILTLTNAVEALAYAYASHLASFPKIISELRELAPDALIIIVGAYNEFEELTLELDGTVIDVGEIFGAITAAINLEALACAMANDNLLYLDASDVETVMEAEGEKDFLNALIYTSNLLPSEEGHQYIFAKITEAVDFIFPESAENHEHIYDNDCDPDCNECGERRTPSAHIYDNGCDEDCNVCGFIRVPDAHSFGEWITSRTPTLNKTGEKVRKCAVCGFEEKEPIPVLKLAATSNNNESSLGAGAIIAISVSSAILLGAGVFCAVWCGVKKKTLAELVAAITKPFAKKK